MKTDILFEDKYIIVCVKPAGICSEAEGMPELLREQCALPEVFCVHRLDRDVSGIMVFAKDSRTAARFSSLFSEGKVKKEYCAAVAGAPVPASGEMKDLLFHDKGKNKTYVVSRERRGVKRAALEYEMIGQGIYMDVPASLVRIALKTGRSHQIRVQFASRKLPLIGDRKYGGPPCSGGIALISRKLSFLHPVTGEEMSFSIPVPGSGVWEIFKFTPEDHAQI